MLFTLPELLNLAIVTVALGYIFMSYLPRVHPSDPLSRPSRFGIDKETFLLALLVTAPAIILHELAHKFSALALGLVATFKVWPFGLFLGVVLKWINSPLLILAPGYVEISGGATDFQVFLTALAGPLTNLLLWFISRQLLEHARKLSRKQAIALYLTKQINLFLFLFNMIPLPPLDGSKVFYSLFKMIT